MSDYCEHRRCGHVYEVTAHCEDPEHYCWVTEYELTFTGRLYQPDGSRQPCLLCGGDQRVTPEEFRRDYRWHWHRSRA